MFENISRKNDKNSSRNKPTSRSQGVLKVVGKESTRLDNKLKTEQPPFFDTPNPVLAVPTGSRNKVNTSPISNNPPPLPDPVRCSAQPPSFKVNSSQPIKTKLIPPGIKRSKSRPSIKLPKNYEFKPISSHFKLKINKPECNHPI